jgi:inosose dehydratase
VLDPKRIGHTGITWQSQCVEEKVADVAAAGFTAFETFGHVIEKYPGAGRGGCAAGHDVGAAGPRGGREMIVVSCLPSEKPTYTHEEYAGLAKTFNRLGRMIRDELGLRASLHLHTETPVEKPDEIARVVEALDPKAIGFGPDTGQIAQAGGDAEGMVHRYRDLVTRIHVKDYGGTPVSRKPDGSVEDPTGYSGYVPVGSGAIDFAAIFRSLKDAGFDGWLMVELDGAPRAPRLPKEAAAMSYRGLTEAIAKANAPGSRQTRADRAVRGG